MDSSAHLHLAFGACVVSEAGRHFLRHARGIAPLNRIAATILALCDGRNTRDDVIAYLTVSFSGQRHATDVNAFLDAAHQQGWIVEGTRH